MIEAQPAAIEVPPASPLHQDSIRQILALLAWVAMWMLVQSLLDKNGFGAKQQVTAFIAGLGTGGTLTGAGHYLKDHKPSVRVIAAAPHPGDAVQGLRALEDGFIPPVLDESVLDGRIVVDSASSFAMSKELTLREGLFVGVSCGSVVKAALRASERLPGEQHIVCLLADGGWKYLSSHLWTTNWEDQPEDVETKIWW